MFNTKRFTIAQIRQHNKAAKQHWFDERSMKYFNTRIEIEPDENHIFITSETPDDDTPRKFSLRQYHPRCGMVDTLGEFWKYKTLDEAEDARKNVTL